MEKHVRSDEQLDGSVGDTNGLEHSVEVVRDKTVTGPLGEEGDGNDDDHTSPVTLGLVEGSPANVGSD